MTLLHRKKIVETYESSRFIINKDNKLKYVNGSIVEDLSILVDFHNKNPIALKYGNINTILPQLDIYKSTTLKDFFDVQIITIPNHMYKWVDIIFDISASNWINYLIEELKDETQKTL